MSSISEERLVKGDDSAVSKASLRPNVNFRSHPYKTVIFLIGSVLSFYLGTASTAFTPLSGALQTALQVPKSRTLLTSSLFIAGNLALAPFVFPTVKSKGLRSTYIIAMCLCSLGAVIRIFFEFGFEIILLGQFFIGLGCSLIINTQMELCYTWFASDERPLYLSLISIANIFGGGFGNTIPLIFVNDDLTDVNTLIKQLSFYIIFSAGAFIFLLLIVLCLFSEKPPLGYGNLTKEEVLEDEGKNFAALTYYYVRYAMSFPVFRSLLLLFTLANSNLVILGTVANDIVKGFGYHSIFGSLAAFMAIFFGLLSAMTYSVIYMKYKIQGPFVAILIFGSILALFSSILFLEFHYAAMYLLSMAVFGIFSLPVVPISMELITRKFTKIPNYVTNTVIVLTSQILTLLIQIIASTTEASQDPGVMALIVLTFYFICLIASRGIDHDLQM